MRMYATTIAATGAKVYNKKSLKINNKKQRNTTAMQILYPNGIELFI